MDSEDKQIRRAKEYFYKAILDSMPQRLFWKDCNSVYRGCNLSGAHALGLSAPDEIIGKTDYDFFLDNVEANYLRLQDEQVMRLGEASYHAEVRAGNGDSWLDVTKIPLRNESGEIYGLLISHEDVTERKKTEEELRIAAATFDMDEAIFITDADANITRVNNAFTKMTGYRPEEVLGKNPRILSSGIQSKDFYAAMWQQLQDTGSWSGEIYDKLKNGETCPKWLTISVLKDKTEKTTGYVAMFTDITERKKVEDKLFRSAHFDSLTGLSNRAMFNDHLKMAVSRAKRGKRQLALFYIDLDGFKEVNDTLGHHAGDELLQLVGKRLEECVRTGDLISRLGGDEFTLIVEDCQSDGLEPLAQKILAAIEAPYMLFGNCEAHISASIGIACCSQCGDERLLIDAADKQMYKVKKNGKKGYSINIIKPAVSEDTVMDRPSNINISNSNISITVTKSSEEDLQDDGKLNGIIYVVDDDPKIAQLHSLLINEYLKIKTKIFVSGDSCLKSFKDNDECMGVILDMHIYSEDSEIETGLGLLKQMREVDAKIPALFVTGLEGNAEKVDAMKKGGYFITKPLEPLLAEYVLNKKSPIQIASFFNEVRQYWQNHVG